MINLLFDRFSKVVLAAEIVGITLMAIATVRLLLGNPSTLTSTLLVVVIVEYIFIRYCASRRWHHNAPRWSGIEKHLKKALVPTSYIIAILGAALLFSPSALLLGIAAFLLAVVVHVNIILLYFHFRNKDDTPANYYSGGKFLKSDRHFIGEPTSSK